MQWMPKLVAFGLLSFLLASFSEAKEYQWGLFAPNNLQEESKKWEELSKFIFNEKGDSVQFAAFPSEQELEKAVSAHQIDLAILRPHEFAALKTNGQLQVIGTFVFNGQTHHFSHFVVGEKVQQEKSRI